MKACIADELSASTSTLRAEEALAHEEVSAASDEFAAQAEQIKTLRDDNSNLHAEFNTKDCFAEKLLASCRTLGVETAHAHEEARAATERVSACKRLLLKARMTEVDLRDEFAAQVGDITALRYDNANLRAEVARESREVEQCVHGARCANDEMLVALIAKDHALLEVGESSHQAALAETSASVAHDGEVRIARLAHNQSQEIASLEASSNGLIEKVGEFRQEARCATSRLVVAEDAVDMAHAEYKMKACIADELSASTSTLRAEEALAHEEVSAASDEFAAQAEQIKTLRDDNSNLHAEVARDSRELEVCVHGAEIKSAEMLVALAAKDDALAVANASASEARDCEVRIERVVQNQSREIASLEASSVGLATEIDKFRQETGCAISRSKVAEDAVDRAHTEVNTQFGIADELLTSTATLRVEQARAHAEAGAACEQDLFRESVLLDARRNEVELHQELATKTKEITVLDIGNLVLHDRWAAECRKVEHCTRGELSAKVQLLATATSKSEFSFEASRALGHAAFAEINAMRAYAAEARMAMGMQLERRECASLRALSDALQAKVGELGEETRRADGRTVAAEEAMAGASANLDTSICERARLDSRENCGQSCRQLETKVPGISRLSGATNLHSSPLVLCEPRTAVVTSQICFRHRSDGNSLEEPERLDALCGDHGLLCAKDFHSLVWHLNAAAATLSDILRVHDITYVTKVAVMTTRLQVASDGLQCPDVILDQGDTRLCKESWDAALHACGCVLHAVNLVCTGSAPNVFCAVRPPGHHVGPNGACGHEDLRDDPRLSQGFCLLNNIAVGAAYAMCVWRTQVRKVAIVDFDVHHGNGTEAIVRRLGTQLEEHLVNAKGGQRKRRRGGIDDFVPAVRRPCSPWLDPASDADNIFFASIHGYESGKNARKNFYPGTGNNCISRKPTIVNVALGRGFGSAEFRAKFADIILYELLLFKPDIIFVSAGFDAHRDDPIGFATLTEQDFAWATEQLLSVASRCCSGRLVSVLEGGYILDGGSFGRSVVAHVRSLLQVSSKHL